MAAMFCHACYGPKDVCERCGYATCPSCSPCPCITGVGSPHALAAMKFYDEYGASPQELARWRLQELLREVARSRE